MIYPPCGGRTHHDWLQNAVLCNTGRKLGQCRIVKRFARLIFVRLYFRKTQRADAFIAAARACILKQDVKTSAEASFFCHASRTAFLIVFDEFRRKISVCFCTFGRAVVVIDGRAEAGRF